MRFLRSGCTIAVFASAMALGASTNWPQFRGPEGDGIARNARPPLAWKEDQNVRWRTPIHSRGWASPVVYDGQIWLATASEDGHELFAVCVDAATGAVRHDQKLFQVAKPQFCHKFNSYASPTPVIEEGRVYLTFGAPGTACLDTATGRVLWERRDFQCNHYRSAGSSPILYGNLLLMHFDGSDHQFVVALDKSTGTNVWRVNRSIDFKDLGPDGLPMIEGDLRKAFSTPHVAMIEGAPVMISQGAKAVYAYNPVNGEELWRVEEREHHSASSRPVVGMGLVFAATGFSLGQVLAIRPGAKGEVVDANAESAGGGKLRVVWKSKRGAPKKPSLILHDELLYGIEDGGVATCWDARTGEVGWNERLGGNYSASPLLAAGRIYFFSEEGKTVVVAANRQFKRLADNTLGDGFMASPAVTGDALILRSRTHLYRVEE